MVEEVRVGDAVDSRVHGDGEEDGRGDVLEPIHDARDHRTTGHSLDEKKEGHDGEYVVVR